METVEQTPPQAATAQPMKLDDLVKTYISVRTKKSQLKKQYDQQVARYDELQEKIEALLLIKFKELGVESIRTEQGTAYTQVRTSASVADWDTFFGFVKEHDAFDMIERRVSKAAVEQYRATAGDLPPGLNWSETRVVNFRSS